MINKLNKDGFGMLNVLIIKFSLMNGINQNN